MLKLAVFHVDFTHLKSYLSILSVFLPGVSKPPEILTYIDLKLQEQGTEHLYSCFKRSKHFQKYFSICMSDFIYCARSIVYL